MRLEALKFNRKRTVDEEGLLYWAIEQHSSGDTSHERKHRWSDELKALCAHASQVARVANIAPDAVRNALIAAKVRSWGWSEAGFCCYEWDKLPERVDQAIVKRHGAGSATQVMLLRKPHTKTALIFNALRRQYMPSSITCVALPENGVSSGSDASFFGIDD